MWKTFDAWFLASSAEVWRYGASEAEGGLCIATAAIAGNERQSTTIKRLVKKVGKLDPGRINSSVAVVRGRWLFDGEPTGYICASNHRLRRKVHGDIEITVEPNGGAGSTNELGDILIMRDDMGAKLIKRLIDQLSSTGGPLTLSNVLCFRGLPSPAHLENARILYGVSLKALSTWLYSSLLQNSRAQGNRGLVLRALAYRRRFVLNIIRATKGENSLPFLLRQSGVNAFSGKAEAKLFAASNVDSFKTFADSASEKLFEPILYALPSVSALRIMANRRLVDDRLTRPPEAAQSADEHG